MSYRPTEEDLRQGRRRLRDLLPAARALARDNLGGIKATSALAEAAFPHATVDNIAALVVYPAPLGGWHADVLFRRTPPGLPNCMGSPVARPYPTRELAEQGALHALAMVIAVQAAGQHKDEKGPVFLLHDFAIPLPAEILRDAIARTAEHERAYADIRTAIRRVEEVLAETLPGGVTDEALKGLTRDQAARLVSVLLTAVMTGLFAYPPRLDAPPAEAPH